jgi:hypothetical protein
VAPPLRHQPAAFVWRHLIFLDRSLDGRSLVVLIVEWRR